MPTVKRFSKLSNPPSTNDALAQLTPAQRNQAVEVAAKLLNKRAEREAKGGTVDLTKG